jgi:selenocysteine lyase/cysteine desulfurase
MHMAAARAAVAELVGTAVSRVALVDNATTGAACVASSLGQRWVTGEWARGDIVLLANYTCVLCISVDVPHLMMR